MAYFIGIGINEDICQKIGAFTNTLVSTDNTWERQSNYHVTLHYLGEVPENTVQGIASDIALLRHTKSSIDIANINTFKSFRDKHILWAGVEASGLTTLHKALGAILEEHGLCPSKREYIPHLTLHDHCPVDIVRKCAGQKCHFGTFTLENIIIYRVQGRENDKVFVPEYVVPL